MPVSIANSTVVYDALKAVEVRLISVLPETWLVPTVRLANEDPEMTVVPVAKEEEAVGIAAGAHFAGTKSALLMQNHGLLSSVNGIVSLAMLYKIPLLMLISYRGGLGERDPWQTMGGSKTIPVLQALGIPYDELSDPASVAKQVRDAQSLAESSLAPVALLLTRSLMWEE
jgi:sulfopyruvate decarboxylase subunit alpha